MLMLMVMTVLMVVMLMVVMLMVVMLMGVTPLATAFSFFHFRSVLEFSCKGTGKEMQLGCKVTEGFPLFFSPFAK